MQYKVGDKVKIINPATYMSVPKNYIGTVMIIGSNNLLFVECKCDKCAITNYGSYGWWFNSCDLEKSEYQMIFSFMED